MASAANDPNYGITFVWKIENFTRLVEGKGFLHSRVFKSFNLSNSTWHVEINLRFGEGDKEHVCVSLQNENLGISCSPMFHWEYSLLDYKEAPFVSKSVRFHDFSKTPLCDLSSGLTVEEVLKLKRSEYLRDDILTINVYLWQPALKRPHNGEYLSNRTLIGIDKTCIKWDIDKFSLRELNQEYTDALYLGNWGCSGNITFSLVEDVNHPLSLEDSFVDFNVFVDLNRLSSVSCEISVLNINKEKIENMSDKYSFNPFFDSEEWVPRHFLSRKYVLSSENQCLKDDVLSLLLEFEVSFSRHVGTTYFRPDYMKNIPERCRDDASNTNRQPSLSTLSPSKLKDNVASFLKGHLGSSDFVLRSGEASFPVHKVVLGAESLFFRNIFYGDKQTEQPRYYDMKNMDSKTLKAMVHFLYGFTMLQEEWESMVKLYYAAVEYQMESLKKHCLSTLKSRISVSNVCSILLKADKNGDNISKSLVYDFLLVNTEEVISSQSWREFGETNSELTLNTLDIINTRLDSRMKKRRSTSPRAEKDKPIGSSDSQPPAKKDKLSTRSESEPSVKPDKQRSSLKSEPRLEKNQEQRHSYSLQAKKDDQICSSESEPLAKKDKQSCSLGSKPFEELTSQVILLESEPLIEKKREQRHRSSPRAKKNYKTGSSEPEKKDKKPIP